MGIIKGIGDIINTCNSFRKSVTKSVEEALDASELELTERRKKCLQKYIERGIVTIDEIHEWEKQGIDPFEKWSERCEKQYRELMAKIDKEFRK